MKKIATLIAFLALISGCSIKKAAFNSVADLLAPPPSDKPIEGANPMAALTGENDPQLVKEFFPTALKLYEIMHLQNPQHEELAVMTGQLYVMYANAFIQGPAEQLPPEDFTMQEEQYRRAGVFYIRGKDFALKALQKRYKGFTDAVFGLDRDAAQTMLSSCSKKDVPALFWAASGLMGAFSLSPLETSYLELLPGSLAMIERASILDPTYNNGAIWEILAAFYAAAPESLGGGKDKAQQAYTKALEITGGKSPGTHILYARSFCIPAQDGQGFDEHIDKALAINPEDDPDNRLVITIAQRQARWLKEHKADFILE